MGLTSVEAMLPEDKSTDNSDSAIRPTEAHTKKINSRNTTSIIGVIA
jgi:hypothetical protein